MYTVVSVLPFELKETKPLTPAYYYIPKSEKNDISILHVGDGSRVIYMGEGKTVVVPVLSETIAHSLVSDYMSAMLGTYSETKDGEIVKAQPGLFYVPGMLSKEEVKAIHADKIALARKEQEAWFLFLVKLADDDYSKTGQHRTISDLQRYAAKYLGFGTRPWITTIETKIQNCPFCGSPISSEIVVCPVCHEVVDFEKYAALGGQRRFENIPRSTPQEHQSDAEKMLSLLK